MKQNGHKGVAGLFLWDVDIEYRGGSFTGKDQRTLTVATRYKTINAAQKKARGHLRQFRYDFPGAKITGVSYKGFIDA